MSLLKQRRAERAAAGGVAVAEISDEPDEDDEADTPAAVLTEDLQQLERSYESWHLALERLWEVERDGPLSEANFARKQWLEYQMVQNLQAQERLRPALEQAQLREAVRAAQAQHDAHLPASHDLAEQVGQAVVTLAALLDDLADSFGLQADPLVTFRSRDGQQHFDDIVDGRSYALMFFTSLFPTDYRADTAGRLLLDAPLTVGRLKGALATHPRLKPFSETAITQYLTQHTKGTSNASA